MAIDADRGITRRKHATGIYIVAYNDTPGIYYDDRGVPISQKLAREAGFNVDRDMRLQQKNSLLEQRRKELEREFAEDEAKLMQQVNDESEDGLEIRTLEAGGYAVFREGMALTQGQVLTYDQAAALVEDLRSEASQSDTAGAAEEPQPPRAPAGGAGAGEDATGEPDALI